MIAGRTLVTARRLPRELRGTAAFESNRCRRQSPRGRATCAAPISLRLQERGEFYNLPRPYLPCNQPILDYKSGAVPAGREE